MEDEVISDEGILNGYESGVCDLGDNGD